MQGNAIDLHVATADARRKKWSKIEPRVNAVVQDAIMNNDAGEKLKSIEWWASPERITRPMQHHILAPDTDQLVPGAKAWSAQRSLDFRRLCIKNKYIEQGSGLLIIKDEHDTELQYWCCTVLHTYSGYFCF